MAKMKVLAAVVTYNRLELLKRCIDHLKKQTYLPDIVIINNSSTDGTEAFLQEAGINYITQENLGSSGGWHRAIAEALEKNYDYIWLMDDDGFPDSNALQILLNTINNDIACVSSVVVKENNPEEFVFGFPKLNKKGNPALLRFKRKYYKLSDLLPKGNTYPFAHFFNGALINIKHIKRIGNVNTDYFIYGDEVDYYCRLRKTGKILTSFDAKHNHPDVSKRNIDDKRVYYFIRNSIIIHNKYFDNSSLRNFLVVIATLVRIFRRNGAFKSLSYLFGNKKKYFYPAIKDGFLKIMVKRY